jgi:short-subunit dehydrogenase
MISSNQQTVKLFLPEMIQKKKGKIVAIASFFAKMTSPMSTVYSATKFGVDGFMNALYDDLCMDDNDENVRLTTAYPYFINTRKELGEMIDECEDILPRMAPEYVADEVVKAVLMRKRKITITPFYPSVLTP